MLISLERFLHGDNLSLEERPVTDDEFYETLKTLKRKAFLLMLSNTSPRQFLRELRVFSTCLKKKGIFPDHLKIAKGSSAIR